MPESTPRRPEKPGQNRDSRDGFLATPKARSARPCCMDHPEECLIIGFSTLGVVQMPHKFNAARRHKFDKVQYRVINWAEYNESLRQRGDLTIWVSEEAQSVWSAPRRTSRGGQRRYSDLAIETCLMLRTAYHLGLRQTQGLMGSIGTLMGLDIRVPDYSTLSRRANGVSIAQVMRQAGSVPIHLVVDSTGHHSGMRKIAESGCEHLLSDSWNTPPLRVFHLTCGHLFHSKLRDSTSFSSGLLRVCKAGGPPCRIVVNRDSFRDLGLGETLQRRRASHGSPEASIPR